MIIYVNPTEVPSLYRTVESACNGVGTEREITTHRTRDIAGEPAERKRGEYEHLTDSLY